MIEYKMFEDNKEYENIEFKDLTLTHETFEEIEFLGCTFTNVKFDNCKFISSLFEKCTFLDSDLSLIQLVDCRITNTTFNSCKLLGINWTLLRKTFPIEIYCTKCDHSYSSFTNMTLTESKFDSCKLLECDFNSSVLKRVEFDNSDLTKAIFFNTDLRDADLTTAKNYLFDVSKNKVKGCKVTTPDCDNLLRVFGLKINSN